MKDPIFIIFTISNFLTSIGFNVPYIFIVQRADTFDENHRSAIFDNSTLISTIGVANTIGRIILGYISDKTWVNRQWIYNISLSVCGIGK